MADLAHITAETLGFLENLLPEDINQELRAVATSMYLALIEDSELQEALSLERLATIAVALLDRVSLDHGGTSFYLPKGMVRKRSQRDREIFAEFNGKNMRELARKHNLSDMRIYQIVNAVKLEIRRVRKGAR